MKVFFDATVLAGALINPTGPNARLPDLASMGGPLRGATSDVVALEFLRHAVSGDLGGVRYELSDIQAFFDAYAPLFEIAQAPIGRALPQRADLHNLPIGEIVFHLSPIPAGARVWAAYVTPRIVRRRGASLAV